MAAIGSGCATPAGARLFLVALSASAFWLSCAPVPPGASQALVCQQVAATLPLAAVARPDGEPDLGLYGYPRVAARTRFTPGATATLAAGGISLSLPPNLYTDPLEFELLVGEETGWQMCLGQDRAVVLPYAYRAKAPGDGALVGRFDSPVQATLTDARIRSSAEYWLTAASNPPTAEQSSAQIAIEGSTLRVANPSARVGWFVVVPRP